MVSSAKNRFIYAQLRDLFRHCRARKRSSLLIVSRRAEIQILDSPLVAHRSPRPVGNSAMFILVSQTYPHHDDLGHAKLIVGESQTTISDLIQISPEDFSKSSAVAIEDKVNEKYANKVILLSPFCSYFGRTLAGYGFVPIASRLSQSEDGLPVSRISSLTMYVWKGHSTCRAVYRDVRPAGVLGRLNRAWYWACQRERYAMVFLLPFFLIFSSFATDKGRLWTDTGLIQ